MYSYLTAPYAAILFLKLMALPALSFTKWRKKHILKV